MKVTRRVSVSNDDPAMAMLVQSGIKTWQTGNHTFADVEVPSDTWNALIEAKGERYGRLTLPMTQFTSKERQESGWCFLRGGKHAGYAIDGFWEVCFDYPNQCRTCGLGALQVTPLRLAKVPKLSHGVLLELVNLWGPLLTTPSSFSEFFAKHNVTSMPVHDKEGNPIEGLVQLGAPPFDPGRLDHRVEQCATCDRGKYWTEVVGFFPRLERYPDGACGTSIRPFGGGAGLSVWYPTFVGGALKAELIEKKVKCDLWPVAD
jgi:hypothetical protein